MDLSCQQQKFAIRAFLRLGIVLLAFAPSLAPAATISFVLQWMNTDSSVEGFLIERSADATNFTQIAVVPGSLLSYQDTGLALGVTYDYRMRAYNGGGTSPYSNVTIAKTPPALTVEVPADDQVVFTNHLIVAGTAIDDTGIHKVTVNGKSTVLDGTGWSASLTLGGGTNTIVVIATDNSSAHQTSTQTVHAVFNPAAAPPASSGAGSTGVTGATGGQPTQLTGPSGAFVVYPAVSNPFAQMSNVTVVIEDEPLLFSVATTAPMGVPLSYAWDFGDQQAAFGSDPTHTYAETNCQAYSVSVAVSDGTQSATGAITVATACQLDVMTLQMKSNFARVNADSFQLVAAMDLAAGFSPAGEVLMVAVGNAQVAFHLDRLGKGTSVYGSCKLTDNPATGQWILKTSLRGGNWQDLWSDDGLINETIAGAPVTVPVAVVIGKNAFAAEPPLHYSGAAGRSGTAR